MSPHDTDLERRLREALAARAAQVGPADLTDAPLPAPARRPRPVVAVLAAAACLVAIGGGVLLSGLGGGDRPEPAPSPDDPDVVVPDDVGRDWPRAGTPPATRLDLDGDGAPERVRFRAEPTEQGFEGRLRLEVDLSGGGSAFGVVDLGTVLYGYDFDPVDADGDGDDELVLARDGADGRSTFPLVVELAGDVLVEAPVATADGAVLRQGPVRDEGAGTDDYVMDRVADFWIADATLHSALSVAAYPSNGMNWWVPEPYVADAWTWRLGADDVLRPVAEAQRCPSTSDDARPECEPGQQDGLPDLGPVAERTVGAGERFDVPGALRTSVEVSEANGDTVLAIDLDGRPAQVRVPGRGVRVFSQPATAVLSDGVALVLDQDADGRPDGFVTAIGSSSGATTRLVRTAPEPSAGSRSWLTTDGEVYVVSGEPATGGEDDEGGATLHQWALGEDGLFTVPRGAVCATGEAVGGDPVADLGPC